MTKASDNIFPKVTFVEGSAPASPAATNFSLYYDSADHLLKWKNSAGTVSTISTAINPLLAYKLDTSGNHTTTSGTLADVDATNAAVTFTAPASTNVLVRLTGQCSADVSGGSNVGAYTVWGLREGGSTLNAGNIVERCSLSSATTVIYRYISIAFVVAGISAGSHTYKWAYSTSAGTSQLGTGATAPAVMEVWAI